MITWDCNARAQSPDTKKKADKHDPLGLFSLGYPNLKSGLATGALDILRMDLLRKSSLCPRLWGLS